MTYKTPLERLEAWVTQDDGPQQSFDINYTPRARVGAWQVRLWGNAGLTVRSHGLGDTLEKAVAEALGDESCCLIDLMGEVWIYAPACNGWHYVSPRYRWSWEGGYHNDGNDLQGLDEGAAHIMSHYGLQQP